MCVSAWVGVDYTDAAVLLTAYAQTQEHAGWRALVDTAACDAPNWNWRILILELEEPRVALVLHSCAQRRAVIFDSIACRPEQEYSR